MGATKVVPGTFYFRKALFSRAEFFRKQFFFRVCSQPPCCVNKYRAVKNDCTHPCAKFNPFRTAGPFWGQSSRIPSSLSPKRDYGPGRVNAMYGMYASVTASAT